MYNLACINMYRKYGTFKCHPCSYYWCVERGGHREGGREIVVLSKLLKRYVLGKHITVFCKTLHTLQFDGNIIDLIGLCNIHIRNRNEIKALTTLKKIEFSSCYQLW